MTFGELIERVYDEADRMDQKPSSADVARVISDWTADGTVTLLPPPSEN